jgi:hypothetical protein
LSERISYAEFGATFFRLAVTEERILAALEGLAGDKIEFGPVGVGPGKFARVKATGEVGRASVSPAGIGEVAFILQIPVALDLHIDLGVDQQSFKAKVIVSLRLTARAAPPLRVVIDIEEPTARDVTVQVAAASTRGAVLQLLAGIDRELKRFVARFVATEIEKPHIREARDIDVASRIEGAWKAH